MNTPKAVSFVLMLLALGGCQPVVLEGAGFETEGEKEAEIVGGARFNGLPAVGALQVGGFLCTATLITPTRVLTAAHCLHNHAASDMVFVTGNDINNPQTRTRVRSSVPHEGYNPTTLDNDIGYFDLVSQPPGVAPIDVVRSMNSSWIGTQLLHVGFGNDNGITDTGAGVKRAVTMPIRSMYPTTFRFGDSRTNVCNGDSGGPALFRTTGGSYQIAGVTSGGDEDCVMFGVDMRVDAYLEFLGLADAPAPTPEPSTPEPSTPEPSTPEPSTPEPAAPMVNMVRAENVTLAAGRINYYDALPVRPGTPFRALLQGSGDGDLYVRWGNRPDAESYDCRPYLPNSGELCELTVPAGVTEVFVAVDAYLDTTYWLDITHQH